MGRWSEHDFGPNADQPVIQVEANGKFITNPEIVVLGDSFSVPNLWQSVVSKEQRKIIRTSDYESNCISNWISNSVSKSTSSIVIIESVERNIISRYAQMSACPKVDSAFIEIPSSIKISHRPIWPPTLDFSYLRITALNTLQLNTSNEPTSSKYLTVNKSLANGCALFSNRRNDKLLYYLTDDDKQLWTKKEIDDSISNILKIQEIVEKSGRKFIFFVAPDKSTVYKKCFKNTDFKEVTPNINQLLIEAGVNAPDMHTQFQSKIDKIVDLYDPDNTHWSSSGYILAGEAISNYIAEKLVSH
jgi:hypothetical protein